MLKRIVIGILFLFCAFLRSEAHTNVPEIPGDTISAQDTTQADSLHTKVTEKKSITPDESFRKKKLITSILAFPVPFGIVGMHRIYLGSEPWVPIVYLVTAGGGIGLLPLIDFFYIISADEEEFKKYENNPRVFMFVE